MKLLSDHRQIHVLDPRSRTDLSAAWTAQATEDRIAAAGDILGIGTERAEEVGVEVESLAARPPDDDAARWEHVTEASLEVGSGEIAVMGCTDYLPDARRIALAAGTWRVRACHAGIGKGPEKILLRLWQGKAREPLVVRRRQAVTLPRKPAAKGQLRKGKQAIQAVRRGAVDDGLRVLRGLADGGDAAAAAAVAEILAFRGRWHDLVPYATALVANPRAVYAGNVLTDMCRLLRRAAAELARPEVIEAAAARVPAGMEQRRDAVLLKDFVEPSTQPGPARVDAFSAALREAEQGKRFRGRPRELAAHCFSLAVSFKVDDEILARWDQGNDLLRFDQALSVARVRARRGDGDGAWAAIRGRLASWWPADDAQVAPLALLLDPLLAPLMTPARCAEVLATPRGPEA